MNNKIQGSVYLQLVRYHSVQIIYSSLFMINSIKLLFKFKYTLIIDFFNIYTIYIAIYHI
jgi:hypothetical protein